MAITPVIMSGGAGSRLWPVSNDDTPKQFLPLISEQTMLEETITRLKADLFDPNTILLAGTSQAELIRSQVSDKFHVIIGEPCRRNTAAAAVAAALYVKEHSPEDDLLLLAPADHVITFPGAFYKAVEKASDAARTDTLSPLEFIRKAQRRVMDILNGPKLSPRGSLRSRTSKKNRTKKRPSSIVRAANSTGIRVFSCFRQTNLSKKWRVSSPKFWKLSKSRMRRP